MKIELVTKEGKKLNSVQNVDRVISILIRANQKVVNCIEKEISCRF